MGDVPCSVSDPVPIYPAGWINWDKKIIRKMHFIYNYLVSITCLHYVTLRQKILSM